jgi:hypothetical protein
MVTIALFTNTEMSASFATKKLDVRSLPYALVLCATCAKVCNSCKICPVQG